MYEDLNMTIKDLMKNNTTLTETNRVLANFVGKHKDNSIRSDTN